MPPATPPPERSGGVTLSLPPGCQIATPVAILPGVGTFSDSDDSDDTSSDSEIETDTFHRAKPAQEAHHH